MVVVARCRWPLTEGLVWEYYLYLYLPKTAQDYLSYLLLVADTDTTTDDRRLRTEDEDEDEAYEMRGRATR